ncbi:E3 ubiquitin-protein ligase PUB23-like [Phragmites australis]|uniref:E3 ubiquitin-protein ligase PUB23-like n=1 Tax=Phragmites australis TaxID=29695 RepID=UPI002D774C4F|nr:E3 ubiquitin-protein ligase PUB23-like [Phragmites australis]
MEEPSHLFLCPISMELMDDPVTVSTGVTYDRRSIERWIFAYGRATCPATMQSLANLDLTPNHTLKRVIDSWLDRATPSTSPSTSSLSSPAHELATPQSRMLEGERLRSALANLGDTPFKVTALKNMRTSMAGDLVMQCEFVSSGGIQVVGRVMAQALAESGAGGDFSAFTVCEEAAAVLSVLPLADAALVGLVLAPECLRPVLALLQRGSTEARLHALDILTKISNAGAGDWTAGVDVDDVLKSLLELLSDESSTRLSSRALDVLLDVVERSRSGPAKAVEVGAVHVLVELLADADDRHSAERILLLLKRLCKCPEGRLAFAEHALSVAAVARTMLRVSELATQLAVKVLWLVSVVAPSEKVLEDMVLTGAVAKLLGLLHVESPPATKQKTVRMVRINGGFWKQYPCFPTDLRGYLRLLD